MCKSCLDCEANIQDADLQSVQERFKTFSRNVTKSVHIYVNLQVVFSLYKFMEVS